MNTLRNAEAISALSAIAVAVSNLRGDPVAQVDCVRAVLALYGIKPGAFEIKELTPGEASK